MSDRCPSCGAPHSPTATYCASCGRPLGAAAAPPAQPAGTASGTGKGMTWIVLVAGGAGCLLVGIALAGIFAALLIPNFLDALQKAKQKRTVADMRTISTALESYRSETNLYPPGPSAADFGSLLSKYGYSGKYLDAWQHPLRYTCLASSGGGCERYELASPGRDGVFDSEPGGYSQESFDPTAYDADIVVGDGEFMRWPQRPSG